MITSAIQVKLEEGGRSHRALMQYASNNGCVTTSEVVRTMISQLPEFKELPSDPSVGNGPSMGNESSKQYHENRDCQEKKLRGE